MNTQYTQPLTLEDITTRHPHVALAYEIDAVKDVNIHESWVMSLCLQSGDDEYTHFGGLFTHAKTPEQHLAEREIKHRHRAMFEITNLYNKAVPRGVARQMAILTALSLIMSDDEHAELSKHLPLIPRSAVELWIKSTDDEGAVASALLNSVFPIMDILIIEGNPESNGKCQANVVDLIFTGYIRDKNDPNIFYAIKILS